MPFLIERNDITRMNVDAIVNAANNTLLGGGGVDGAIHRAAGKELLEECRRLGGCETGEAKATGAYMLPAKYVIHTVGPVWRGGGYGEEGFLRSCYEKSLALAESLGCGSVAFPLISAGAYGYPRREAISIATETIRSFLEDHEMTVYLVIFDRKSFDIGGELMGEIRAYVTDNYVSLREDKLQYLKSRRMHALGSMPAQNSAPMEAITMARPNAVLCDMMEGAREYEEADIGSIISGMDEGFSRTLLKLIDLSGMTDAECYKKANIDRKLFSKIRSDPNYRPSKPTVVAFAVALRLDLNATEDLLKRAGFALSRSFKFDVIVEYFIRNGIYDVFRINEALFEFDQPLLGG